VSLERTLPMHSTESALSSNTSDSTAQGSDGTPPEGAHDRWILFVNTLTNLLGTWGSTLRLAFLVTAVGVTGQLLLGCVPWDQLADLFKLR
jgi:hypothetical protein